MGRRPVSGNTNYAAAPICRSTRDRRGERPVSRSGYGLTRAPDTAVWAFDAPGRRITVHDTPQALTF
jgi:hypothetical protein